MALGDVIRNRRSAKAFATTVIPNETLVEVLRLMQVPPRTMTYLYPSSG